MHISFESLNELDSFLHWADKYRAVVLTINRTRDPIGCAPAAEAPDTTGVAFDTPQSALKGDHVALMDGAQPGGGHVEPGAASGDKSPEGGEPAGKVPEQPATRKRRTKAEIAADEKAAEEKRLADVKKANEVADASRAENFEEAGPAMKQATEGSATPTGTNPFEQVATAGDGAARGAEGGETPDAETDAAVTPFLHLTRAREFIAKHGMPKYNESFTKAGLDPNVMGYNAEQRAQHMATLAELDKA